MRLKKKPIKTLGGLAIFLVLMGILSFYRTPEGHALVNITIDGVYQEFGLTPPQAKQYPGGVLVHFIDVGQADATLIQTSTQNILIDAGIAEGYNGGNEIIPAYLRAQGVEKLDLVIATHMHSDHIAGMKDVLLMFGSDRIIFPEIPEALTPTGKGYEELLKAVAVNGRKITPAHPGDRYEIGDGAVLTLLAPISPSKDMNENSIVCRLEYGQTAFMLMGDAGAPSEMDIIERKSTVGGDSLRANLLKLGHHGSSTSSSAKWLDTVKPSVAVASMGADNPYGHPSSAVVKRLRARDIQLYRTDKSGSIVASSNGSKITIETQTGAAEASVPPPATLVSPAA